MKNLLKLFGIIALVAIIGFSMTACGGDDDSGGGDPALNGTWESIGGELKLNNGNWEMSESAKGKYTTSGGTITITTTHFYSEDDGKWYSRSQMKTLGVPEDQLAEMFAPQTGTYVITGTTLVMTIEGDTISFTKKGGGSTPPGGGGNFAAFAGTWKNDADATDIITITADGNWTRTGGTSSTKAGILHNSGSSASTPNIRDNSGSNIGTAKIENGKLVWSRYSDTGAPPTFTKQ